MQVVTKSPAVFEMLPLHTTIFLLLLWAPSLILEYPTKDIRKIEPSSVFTILLDGHRVATALLFSWTGTTTRWRITRGRNIGRWRRTKSRRSLESNDVVLIFFFLRKGDFEDRGNRWTTGLAGQTSVQPVPWLNGFLVTLDRTSGRFLVRPIGLIRFSKPCFFSLNFEFWIHV